MKLNILSAVILFAAALFSSACYRTEVRADRSNRTDDNPVTISSNRTTSGNSVKTPSENKTAAPSNTKIMENNVKTEGFRANLPSSFQMPSDDVGLKLLREYGSVCLAAGGATAPSKILFRDEAEVSAFHSSLQKSSETIGNHTLELQAPAMTALKAAIADAERQGKKITPRGADSAKRTYGETVRLWESRVTPGLAHWVSKGKISQSEADRIKALSPFDQVSEILKLESQGIYFAKDLSKSILYSVAAPGASQHIFMLALDIEQFADAEVRAIMAKHGWFQTVQSDLPHFTYLGVNESELSAKGLKAVTVSGQKFWVPNI